MCTSCISYYKKEKKKKKYLEHWAEEVSNFELGIWKVKVQNLQKDKTVPLSDKLLYCQAEF